MIGLAESFQFDLIIFSLGFIITELVTRNFPKLRLFIANGRKKIKIHHAYLGVVGAFFASLTGQAALLNISLGTMANDLFCHLKNKISKLLKKTR
ncbi:MAG: hypothetical protein QXU74_02425 [Candidatus Aenigmatarchaeota archaeon]